MPMKMKWSSVPPVLAHVAGSRAFRIAVAALVIYALLGFLLLPYVAERHIPQYARETLQRQADVADVRFNPFLFIFEADGFRLREADGRPIVAARQLLIDFDLSSLLRWAWTFADIRADGLQLNIVREADGRFNLGALADSFPMDEEPPKPDAGPPRLVLSRIVVSDGSLTYRDLSAEADASATLEPVNIALDNVTTLPQRDSNYAFNAEFPGGGSIYLRGTTHVDPFTAVGDISIQGVHPKAFWRFLQDQLQLDEPQGEIVVQAVYRFSSEKTGPQFDLRDIRGHIAGLDVREPGAQAPLLALETVELAGGRFDLRGRNVVLPELALRNGRVSAALDEQGNVNWQQLVRAPAATKVSPERRTDTQTQPADAETDEPWRIQLSGVTLDGIAVQAVDHSRRAPLQLDVDAIGAHLSIDINAGIETTFIANAERIAVQGAGLKPLDADTPLTTLDRIELLQGTVNSAERTLGIGRLAFHGGGTLIERDADGKFRPLETFAGRPRLVEAAKAAADDAEAWRIDLNTLETDALRLAFVDHGPNPALRYTLEDVAVTLNEFSTGTEQPARFTAGARVAEGGALEAQGTFAPDASKASASMKVEKFALEPLRSLLARHAALDIKQGNLSAELAVEYEQSTAEPRLRASGAARIDDLRIDEEITGDRFVAWKTLSADTIAFMSDSAPARLTVKDMRLLAPRARIEIFEDRSVNLGKVFDKERAEATAESPSTSKSAADDDEASLRVDVARIRVDNGVVFYADHSLVLPFAAEVREFNGTASGISSARDSRTRLEFEGRVEDYGSAKVSGALSPFAPKQFTDIRTQFRNIDMPPLSPYSATFAGRKIASGKLSLDLEYKINDGALAGDNEILLERFTLGERVESPDALDLPLDLAVALLTDSRGRIDIAIPVSGNMNKPEFSLGGVIGEAVARMLTRIVTAPFSALGKLLGGGDQGSNRIAFEPGSARLTPPQQEKLVNVGKALQDRPQLQLSIGGRYDPQLDGAALRAERVRRDLAAELDVQLAEDEAPVPIAFEQAATQGALEDLLEARAGDDAVDEFQAAYEKRTGKPVQRVNPVFGLLGQASADHAFYEALFERLVEVQPLADTDLQALARQRARAIEQALMRKGGVAAERIAIGEAAAAAGNRDKLVETQMDLEVYRTSSK